MSLPYLRCKMYKLQLIKSSAEGRMERLGTGLHSQPSVGAVLGEVYGEFVRYRRAGRTGSHTGSETSSKRVDHADQSSGAVVKKIGEQQDGSERRDSGKDLTHSFSTSAEASNTEATEASSSAEQLATRSFNASTTHHTPANPPKESTSNLHIDLRTQSLINDLPTFLSTCHTAKLRCIKIFHSTVFSADNEEDAFTRPATTLFTTHRDGSISVLCYLDLSTWVGCICAIESVLVSLIRGEAAREEPAHMQAKRKMWRRLSSASTVPQLDDGTVDLGDVAQTPLLALVAKFVGLLRPKLGCGPHVGGTAVGLEVFERPVCSAGSGLLEALGGCGRCAFHVAGNVEGVDVDMSGYGRRGHVRVYRC
jgi:hypothetical protein